MNLVIGDGFKSTSIDTEERRVAIAPDKGDKLVIVLGINRVQIEHTDGSWVITHGPNVISNLLAQRSEKAFSPVGTNLVDELRLL